MDLALQIYRHQSQQFDHLGRNEIWREPFPPARTCDKDQLLAGALSFNFWKLKQRVYTQGYADIGWVFLTIVVTTLVQLALELLCYLLLCAGQAAQLASVAAGDVSTPVDEVGRSLQRRVTLPSLSCGRSSSSSSRTLSWWRFWRLWLVECLVSVWAFNWKNSPTQI